MAPWPRSGRLVVWLTLCAALVGCGTPTGPEPGAAPASDGATAGADTTAVASEDQEYRALVTVLENPEHGPQLCFAVAGSYPPQCGGPDIAGWDWEAVDGEESANGVTWIDGAVVTGTWDGSRFTLTRPVEPQAAWTEPPAEDPDVAPGCDEPDVADPSAGRRGVDAATAALDGEPVVAVRVSDPATGWDGPFVLTVTVPPGRSARTTDLIRQHYAGALCVVERDQPTRAELHDVVAEVIAEAQAGGSPLGPIIGGSPNERRGVVEVQVLVADEDARAWARERWGDLVDLVGVLVPVD